MPLAIIGALNPNPYFLKKIAFCKFFDYSYMKKVGFQTGPQLAVLCQALSQKLISVVFVQAGQRCKFLKH